MSYLLKNENLIAFLILFLAFLYSAFSFMGYYSNIIYAFDIHNVNPLISSDSMQLYVMFKDLVLEGNKWSDWYFSAAPYFFPDMLICFFLNLIIPSFYYTFIAYFLIQQFLLFLALLFFVKEIKNDKSFIVTSIIFIFILNYSFAHIYSFLPVFHFSEFVFGIFWLVLAIKILKNNSTLYMGLFVLLGSLLKFSDNVFIIHFMLPFACAILLLKILSYITLKKFFIFIFLLCTSYFIGSLLYHLIMPVNTQYIMDFSLKSFLDNFDSFVSLFLKNRKIKIFSILFVCSILFFTFVLIFNDNFKVKLRANTFLLMLFSIFACGGFFVFTSHTLLPIAERYYFAIVCVPVAVFLMFILPYFKNFLLPLLVITFIFSFDFKAFKEFKFNKNYSTNLSSCVNELASKYNLKNGVSEYWQAKLIYALTDIKMAQVYNNLLDHYAITTKSFFNDKYDFIIINNAPLQDIYKLNKEYIIGINGKPDELITCGDSEILYYKDGLYLSYLNKYNKEVFDANNKLHTNIGKIDNGEIVVNDNSAQNYAVFGPFIDIKKGKYKVDIVYSSSLKEDEEPDLWDINLIHQNGAELVKNGTLKGTNSKYKTFSVDFENKEDVKFEARVFYKGKGELKIKEIILYKK